MELDIKSFCKEIASQDNMGTRWPIFIVMSKVQRIGNNEYEDDGYREEIEDSDEVVYFVDEYKPYNDNFFLTRKNAEAFMQANKHNMSEPYVYCSHAYRNLEIKMIVDYLFKQSGFELPRFRS